MEPRPAGSCTRRVKRRGGVRSTEGQLAIRGWPWGQGVGGKSQREPGLQLDPLPPRGVSQSGECISEPDSETQVLIKKLKDFFIHGFIYLSVLKRFRNSMYSHAHESVYYEITFYKIRKAPITPEIIPHVPAPRCGLAGPGLGAGTQGAFQAEGPGRQTAEQEHPFRRQES